MVLTCGKVGYMTTTECLSLNEGHLDRRYSHLDLGSQYHTVRCLRFRSATDPDCNGLFAFGLILCSAVFDLQPVRVLCLKLNPVQVCNNKIGQSVGNKELVIDRG